MDLVEEVVEPIATGAAVLGVAAIANLMLGTFGYAPFSLIAANLEAQGFIGLVATL